MEFTVNTETKGKDLYDVVNKVMKFDEVVELYKRLAFKFQQLDEYDNFFKEGVEKLNEKAEGQDYSN